MKKLVVMFVIVFAAGVLTASAAEDIVMQWQRTSPQHTASGVSNQ